MAGGGKKPGWVKELEIRRLLWQEYGIAFADATPLDIFRIIEFHNAEVERNRASQ